jgi:hypothetical protein
MEIRWMHYLAYQNYLGLKNRSLDKHTLTLFDRGHLLAVVISAMVMLLPSWLFNPTVGACIFIITVIMHNWASVKALIDGENAIVLTGVLASVIPRYFALNNIAFFLCGLFAWWMGWTPIVLVLFLWLVMELIIAIWAFWIIKEVPKQYFDII